MLELFSEANVWGALIVLTGLEIILGVDNLIYVAIVSNSVVAEKQVMVRRLGLLFALFTRLILLFSLNAIAHMKQVLFSIDTNQFTIHDVVFILGGGFLILNAIFELSREINFNSIEKNQPIRKLGLWSGVFRIMFFDIIFSLDSVITAVGIAKHIYVMVIAIVLGMIAMLGAANLFHRFIERYPSIKILALSFLILVGFALISDGMSWRWDYSFIYIALGFSLFVEVLNLIGQKRHECG